MGILYRVRRVYTAGVGEHRGHTHCLAQLALPGSIMAIQDSRFTLPPEDFEDGLAAQSTGSDKGKSREQTSKKRKRQQRAQEEEETPDLYDEVLNGPLPSTSRLSNGGQAEADLEDADAQDEDDAVNEPMNTKPKPLDIEALKNHNSKVDRTGIIYLSRIPPGMGPSKVKHILSNYGEVGRIYLVADDPASSKSSHHTSKSGKERFKHRPHRFKEGWVEFMDKKVARSTAEILNANLIGDVAVTRSSGKGSAKKNGGTKKWKDDVWTMKYLPKFKWNMLSEQVAIEAATRQALLRNQLAQSKKEQAEYLRQVDRASAYEKAQLKKRGREERRAEAGETGGDATAAATEQGAGAGPAKKAKKE